jgi:hypothetical protein
MLPADFQFTNANFDDPLQTDIAAQEPGYMMTWQAETSVAITQKAQHVTIIRINLLMTLRSKNIISRKYVHLFSICYMQTD